ncbi:MAG: transporter substrate-binding domain-containing protein, partial [Pygmaiobacter sp.]
MMKFARKALCFALSVTLLCCCAFGASAHGEKRVIRVGYPIQSGFTQKNETGQYFGYTYEYLLKLSQFTDWSYEFVEVPGDVNESLTTLLKMLQEGEIDLLGGILQNQYTEGLYDFPQLSYGIGYTQLAALEGNTAINELNFMHKVPLRVAVWTASKQRIAELQHFCEDNRITLEIIECDSVEQQYEKLCDGSADAMLNVDLSRHKNTHSIARFAGRPYYFALTKGNTALAQELDDAIRKIGETDQGFEKRLYDIYFGEETTELRLNDTERAYLETAGPITVLI